MKFLFSGDIHAHNFQQFSYLHEGWNTRLLDVLDVLEEMREYCVKHEVKHAFLLGDIFHSRPHISTDVLVSVYSKLKNWSTQCKLYILVGNHDTPSKVGDISSVDVFNTFATVINTPTNFFVEGVNITAIPHTYNKELLKKSVIDLVDNIEPDLLLFHFALKEGKVADDYSGVGEISVQDLHVDNVRHLSLGGDFHQAQVVQDKCMYVGSPLQLNYGESGHRKGFWIMEIEHES